MTRTEFLGSLGAFALGAVTIKLSTLETRLVAVAKPAARVGYGSSVYGGTKQT